MQKTIVHEGPKGLGAVSEIPVAKLTILVSPPEYPRVSIFNVDEWGYWMMWSVHDAVALEERT